MSERINVHEVTALHPELMHLSDGDQVKMNHPNCVAGKDHKSRLYVKRDGPRLLFYCHHCGLAGVKGGGQINHIRKHEDKVVSQEISLPYDFVTDPADCHVLANAWFNKYGITREEREYYQFGWSAREKRAILPVTMDGELVAYQLRRLLPEDTGPKYTTTRKAGVRQALFTGAGPDAAADVMVLVEDMLSAVVVGRHVTTTALLGVHLRIGAMPWVLRFDARQIMVWLDDDNPAVRSEQRQLVRRLQPYADVHKVTGIFRDPKELSADCIHKILRGK